MIKDSTILVSILVTNIMWVLWAILHLLYSHKHEGLPITVSLFVDEDHIDKMKRTVIPSVGDTIVIDCGNMVKVIDVNHDWGTPDLVQINCTAIEESIPHIEELSDLPDVEI